jgi:peptidoglycan lytic transglycosylase
MAKGEWRMANGPSAKPLQGFSFRHPPSAIRHLAAAALALALAACGTAPVSKAPPRPGGYYLDDGPGANPPANIDGVPDALPRAEPINRGTARPYVVMGKSYTPMTALAPYKARGIASWYGRRYHGKLTSSGEPYDMYAMTAAHTTLPIPSYARVTNVKNGKSVVVRVNDRGPFVEGRIIDLSYTAAHRLGVLAGGAALVDVEIIIPGGAGTAIASAPSAAPPEARAEGVPAAPMREPVAVDPPPPVEPSVPPPAAQIPVTADAGGYYLQLGAFGSRDNAENFLTRMRAQVDWLAGSLHIFARDGLFRVHAGPYAGEVEARRDADRVTQSLGVRPFVLTR